MWHGPQCDPLLLRGKDKVDTGNTPIPYFGIISRGLLNRLSEIKPQGHPNEWSTIAPWFEFDHPWFLNKNLKTKTITFKDPIKRQLNNWFMAAKDCNFVSVQESAYLCKKFLLKSLTGKNKVSLSGICRYFGLKDGFSNNIDTVNIWLVKEGFTSSVWRVEINSEVSNSQLVLCMNVARDIDASVELASTYQHLLSLYQKDPLHIAQPFGIDFIRAYSWDKSVNIAVTVHSWVEGHEIHVKKYRDNNIAKFILVKWFLPENGNQGKQSQIVGRELTQLEHDHFWEKYLAFLAKHATIDRNEKKISVPRLELNEGDIIWNDKDLFVIAISATDQVFTIKEWSEFQSNPYVIPWPKGPKLYRK